MVQIINYGEKFEDETLTLEEFWNMCFRRLAQEPENQDEMMDELIRLLFNLLYYHLVEYGTVEELCERSLQSARSHQDDYSGEWVWWLENWILSKIAADPMLCEYGSQVDRAVLLQILSKHDYIDPLRFEKCDCIDMITWDGDLYTTKVCREERNSFMENFALYKNDDRTALLDNIDYGKIFLCKQTGFVYVNVDGGHVCIDLKNQTVSEKRKGDILKIIGRALIWETVDEALCVDRLNDDGSSTRVVTLHSSEGNVFRLTCFPFYFIMDDTFKDSMETPGLGNEASYIKNIAIRMIWKVFLIYCFDVLRVHGTQYPYGYFEGEQLADIRGTTISWKLIKQKFGTIRKLLLSGVMKFKKANVMGFLEAFENSKYSEETDITVDMIRFYADVWQSSSLIRWSQLSSPVFRYIED